jgi:hypothetical protein
MRKSFSLCGQYGLVAVLALSLVLSQALWLLHRVAHVAIATHASAASSDQKAGSWAKALLPVHQDERSCAQYDQLNHHALIPGCEPPDLVLARVALAQATHVASRMAAQAAAFLARGPPVKA